MTTQNTVATAPKTEFDAQIFAVANKHHIKPEDAAFAFTIIHNIEDVKKEDPKALCNRFINEAHLPVKSLREIVTDLAALSIKMKATAKSNAAPKAKKPSTKKSAPKEAPATPKTDAPKGKGKKGTSKKSPFKSITEAVYHLFNTKGADETTVEEATKAAIAVKPDSKFNRWHLYFHRRNWKVAQAEAAAAQKKSGKK